MIEGAVRLTIDELADKIFELNQRIKTLEEQQQHYTDYIKHLEERIKTLT